MERLWLVKTQKPYPSLLCEIRKAFAVGLGGKVRRREHAASLVGIIVCWFLVGKLLLARSCGPRR